MKKRIMLAVLAAVAINVAGCGEDIKVAPKRVVPEVSVPSVVATASSAGAVTSSRYSATVVLGAPVPAHTLTSDGFQVRLSRTAAISQ